MALICSWDWRLLSALCNGFLCRLAVQHPDTRARLQLVLSVDHDLFVGCEAGIDQRLTITDLRDLDRADSHGVVGIDDVGIGSVGALLHDRGRYRQAVVPCIEEQSSVDELA